MHKGSRSTRLRHGSQDTVHHSAGVHGRCHQEVWEEHAKPCLVPQEAEVHLTKADQRQTEDDKTKMSSTPYRSRVGSRRTMMLTSALLK
ncbi:hypothetical protein PC116_g20329 [Phytophthora cactorum]|nr:hypothetical protein PC116_g20329 [Phytophthora cactorum]